MLPVNFKRFYAKVLFEPIAPEFDEETGEHIKEDDDGNSINFQVNRIYQTYSGNVVYEVGATYHLDMRYVTLGMGTSSSPRYTGYRSSTMAWPWLNVGAILNNYASGKTTSGGDITLFTDAPVTGFSMRSWIWGEADFTFRGKIDVGTDWMHAVRMQSANQKAYAGLEYADVSYGEMEYTVEAHSIFPNPGQSPSWLYNHTQTPGPMTTITTYSVSADDRFIFYEPGQPVDCTQNRNPQSSVGYQPTFYSGIFQGIQFRYEMPGTFVKETETVDSIYEEGIPAGYIGELAANPRGNLWLLTFYAGAYAATWTNVLCPEIVLDSLARFNDPFEVHLQFDWPAISNSDWNTGRTLYVTSARFGFTYLEHEMLGNYAGRINFTRQGEDSKLSPTGNMSGFATYPEGMYIAMWYGTSSHVVGYARYEYHVDKNTDGWPVLPATMTLEYVSQTTSGNYPYPDFTPEARQSFIDTFGGPVNATGYLTTYNQARPETVNAYVSTSTSFQLGGDSTDSVTHPNTRNFFTSDINVHFDDSVQTYPVHFARDCRMPGGIAWRGFSILLDDNETSISSVWLENSITPNLNNYDNWVLDTTGYTNSVSNNPTRWHISTHEYNDSQYQFFDFRKHNLVSSGQMADHMQDITLHATSTRYSSDYGISYGNNTRQLEFDKMHNCHVWRRPDQIIPGEFKTTYNFAGGTPLKTVSQSANLHVSTMWPSILDADFATESIRQAIDWPTDLPLLT